MVWEKMSENCRGGDFFWLTLYISLSSIYCWSQAVPRLCFSVPIRAVCTQSEPRTNPWQTPLQTSEGWMMGLTWPSRPQHSLHSRTFGFICSSQNSLWKPKVL